jgi:gas vesicle protein
MSKKDWIEAGASLLSGAGIGAALMYLFDPDNGQARRDDARDASGNLISTAGDQASTMWGRLSDRAMDAGHHIADAASHWTSRAGQAASDAGSAASHFADQAASQARSYGRGVSKSAGKYANRAGKTAQGWVGYEPSSPYTTAAEIALGTVGALALGAGVMFLLDPAQGRRRRAMLKDKTFSAARKATHYVEGTSRHLGNRTKGLASEVSGKAQEVASQVKDFAGEAKDKISNAASSAIGNAKSSSMPSAAAR